MCRVAVATCDKIQQLLGAVSHPGLADWVATDNSMQLSVCWPRECPPGNMNGMAAQYGDN